MEPAEAHGAGGSDSDDVPAHPASPLGMPLGGGVSGSAMVVDGAESQGSGSAGSSGRGSSSGRTVEPIAEADSDDEDNLSIAVTRCR